MGASQSVPAAPVAETLPNTQEALLRVLDTLAHDAQYLDVLRAFVSRLERVINHAHLL